VCWLRFYQVIPESAIDNIVYLKDPMAFALGRTVADLSREYYEFTVNAVETVIALRRLTDSEEIYHDVFPEISSAFPDMEYSRERLEMDLETLLIDGRASNSDNVWRLS
jgi:hypothetical protein